MSWFKRLGRKILGGLKSGARKVLDIGKGARKLVGGVYNQIKKIPVVGDIVDKALDTKILGGRLSIKDIANNAGNAIEAGDRAYSGDFKGAYDSAKQMKYKKGGLVRIPRREMMVEDDATGGRREIPRFKPIPKPWMSMYA